MRKNRIGDAACCCALVVGGAIDKFVCLRSINVMTLISGCWDYTDSNGYTADEKFWMAV
jgi:hypothetical protein